MTFIRRWIAARRLARSLKPDPAFMQRRLSQLSPERRARQIAVTEAIHG